GWSDRRICFIRGSFLRARQSRWRVRHGFDLRALSSLAPDFMRSGLNCLQTIDHTPTRMSLGVRIRVQAAYGVVFVILIVTDATRLSSVSSTSFAPPLTYPGLSQLISHSPWAIPMIFHSPLRFDVAVSVSPTRGRLATHFTSGSGAPLESTIV